LEGFGKSDLCYYVERIFPDFYVKLLIRKEIFLFDDCGVPIVRDVLVDGKCRYNPATVCIWGLENLSKYLRGETWRLIYVRNCAKWLEDNAEKTAYGSFVWRHNVDWQLHGLKSGYISGMAQGLAISLLLRGAILFKRYEYSKLAEESFNPMILPIEKGGVAIIKNDFYWAEEIPSKTPSLVLNGFIFSLFGIYDLYRFVGKKMYKEWFDKGILTLLKMLPRYDLRTWSRYDLGLKVIRSKTNLLLEKILSSGEMHNIATPSYNVLHVDQLRALYEITGATQFSYYAKRWSLNPLKYIEFLTYLLST
jgi:heparosan-N-sulfate-glucuronate 5-epimerase